MSSPEAAYLVATFTPVLWLGFLLAISFMEAPLKFRAPNVTRQAALSIGRVVFRALTRVELALLLLQGFALWLAGWPAVAGVWFALLVFVLGVQQLWLLPRLDRRAVAFLAGEAVSPNRTQHKLYVAGECLKLTLLPGLSWALARNLTSALGG